MLPYKLLYIVCYLHQTTSNNKLTSITCRQNKYTCTKLILIMQFFEFYHKLTFEKMWHRRHIPIEDQHDYHSRLTWVCFHLMGPWTRWKIFFLTLDIFTHEIFSQLTKSSIGYEDLSKHNYYTKYLYLPNLNQFKGG